MQPTSKLSEGQAVPTVALRPVGFRARAWWGEQLLADSGTAVRVTEPGRAPALHFPVGDVRVDLLEDDGRTVTCPVKGVARLWSVPGVARAAGAGSWSAYGQPEEVDGVDAVWSFPEPVGALAELAGTVVFDHDRVRVELVDVMGAAESDVTIKRFPTWGDASDLVEVLSVERQGDTSRFVGPAGPDTGRPVVEGSQILGQAIVAAGQLCPGRRVVSAHMVFLRAADARIPLELEVDELSAGRTFNAYAVRAVQSGRLRAHGTLMLDATAPDLIRHAEPAPDVAGPRESPAFDMGVTGRDIRVVDGAYTIDPDEPLGPPVLDAWVRFSPVEADEAMHAALVAQFTGHLSLAAAMRPHPGIGEAQAHRTISTGINAITLSLHADIRADQWLLYHHLSTSAGDGMTHAECRVHDEGGALVASFTVDGMVRGFADPTKAVDSRTAM